MVKVAIQGADERWQEIRAIHKEHKFSYQLGGGATLVLIGVVIGAALFGQDPGYQINLYTDVLSIAVTVFILDLLARRRVEQQVKAQLIREMGSSDNGISRRAVRELRENGALQDGSLKNAFLPFANLQEADLMWANLENARLDGATLLRTWFDSAHLHKTSLRQAILHGATMQCTNLPFADLSDAVLYGANLENAELVFVNLTNAHFNTDTILPDGNNWTTDVDMTRFTNPKHPDFWRSNDPNSPAYIGETNEG